MAKNIAYQTKRQGKSVSGEARRIQYLKTNLQGGGTCDWVPEDETQLITKVITQDGIYVASNEPGNIYGYSEVTVQGIGSEIMGDLGTITISKNGTYYAANAYKPTDLGFSSEGSEETKIGPFYGYKTVIVNVTGGSSESGSSESGSTSSTMTISGKDSTGSAIQVATDERGYLITKKLASEIRVTTNPNFLTYKNGESINYKGIKVTAYQGSEVYKVLEQAKLIFPIKKAEGGGGRKQTIPVQWARDGDGVILETSFEITVNDA